MLSSKYYEIFENNYSEEYLGTAVVFYMSAHKAFLNITFIFYFYFILVHAMLGQVLAKNKNLTWYITELIDNDPQFSFEQTKAKSFSWDFTLRKIP